MELPPRDFVPPFGIRREDTHVLTEEAGSMIYIKVPGHHTDFVMLQRDNKKGME